MRKNQTYFKKAKQDNIERYLQEAAGSYFTIYRAIFAGRTHVFFLNKSLLSNSKFDLSG